MTRHDSPEQANTLQHRLDSPRGQALERRHKSATAEVERLRTLRDTTPEGPQRNSIRSALMRAIERRDTLAAEWNRFLHTGQ